MLIEHKVPKPSFPKEVPFYKVGVQAYINLSGQIIMELHSSHCAQIHLILFMKANSANWQRNKTGVQCHLKDFLKSKIKFQHTFS